MMKDFFKCSECEQIHHLPVRPAFQIGSSVDFKCDFCSNTFWKLPTQEDIEHYKTHGRCEIIIDSLNWDPYITTSKKVADELENDLISKGYVYRKDSVIRNNKRYYEFEAL